MSDPLGAFLQGLVGDDETPGFQGGFGFRRKLTKDREDTAYERARRLREEVGFGLQQRVREGELAQQGRQQQDYERRTTLDTEHRARIASAAAQIRQQYGQDPRYKGLTLLPDEELVNQFGDILTHPERYTSERRQREIDTRQDLTSVERQVDDTRADITRVEREQPTRPAFFVSPQAEQQFKADSAAVGERLLGLRQRADSLGGVRDSIAGVVQGRRPTARPASKTPAQWVSEVRREHPDWTPEQVAAEARKRSGTR